MGRAPFSARRREHYLRALRLGLNATQAAAKVGVSRDTPYDAAERDPEFAAAVAEAKGIGEDLKAALVEAHEMSIQRFLSELSDELPAARKLLVDAMKGSKIPTAEQWRAMVELVNRAVGRPPIHIHGHKDAAELEAEREFTVRIVRDGG